MSAEHERFEMQCALAVSGALDEGEFAELCGHLEECGACRERLDEWMSVGASLAGGSGGRGRSSSLPAGGMRRFAMRVARECVPVRQPAARTVPGMAMAFVAIAVTAAFLLFQHERLHPVELQARISTGSATGASSLRGPVGAVFAKADGTLKPVVHRDKGAALRAHDREQRRRSGVANSSEAMARLEIAAFDAIPKALPRFLLPRSTATCEADGEPSRWRPESSDTAHEKRVFCYNPRVASLTSLDLYHAAASNAPVFRADLAGFRLFVTSEEITRP